ncbi:hypothetical protein BDV38DRAFT_283864 [Aspergillus pseudotamarii]|uniref:Amidohydrolase-related domain-containing protein n=1 Tax=Aspergillus pseudotamarii TaxID=132259 RepID=A0A5N6SSA6_ASPPS|nr:uncharacterized protein BDV38DRAFT_283864 [Aspergillus pseudotamarii]KAE8136650.1 hypothetical protein BDV38DRAFT_283864 [Aspergillus pseudotamarii]
MEQVWTPLSGTYRFPNVPDLDEYVTDMLRTATDRVVWTSDWPHSGGMGANPERDRKEVQEYRKLDDTAFITRCRKRYPDVEGGTGDQLACKIGVENQRKLWQWDDDE